MTKRTVHGVALILLAAPLMVVSCSDSGDKDGGTAGAGGLKYDGAAGAGGSHLDGGAGPEVQVPPVDAQVINDTLQPVDTVVVDAPVLPDAPAVIDVAPVLDVSLVDTRPAAVDAAAIEAAIDTTPAVDTTPVVAVCTETNKFDGTTDVTTDRTLTKACSPYAIKESFNVSGNATLTIEAGVTLNMGTDAAIIVGSGATAGRLVATGTAANPIVFTSPTAGAGDWIGIEFWGNTITGSSISYAKFDYCGQARFACIHGEGGVKTGRVTIDHVTVDHIGLNANAITQKDTDSNFAITNCTFKNVPTAQYAVSVDGESFAGIDSTNAFNGSSIELRGGDISATTTWKNPGTSVAVVVTDKLNVDGAPAPTLTIAAGTNLLFVKDSGIAVGSKGGMLKIVGTVAAPITLTSANTPPSAGDWNGIILWSNGNAKIAYTTISYAGSTEASSSNGALSVVADSNSIDIQNSTISHSAQYGIGIRCGSTATVGNTGNTFTDNALGDVGPGPDETAAACQ